MSADIGGVLFVASACFATTTISQGYSTEGDIPVGSIVGLLKDSSDTVEAMSIQTNDRTIGVVINTGSSLLTLDNGSKSQIQVTTNGVVPVLASDCNGSIAVGDPITASPLRGLGSGHGVVTAGLVRTGAWRLCSQKMVPC